MPVLGAATGTIVAIVGAAVSTASAVASSVTSAQTQARVADFQRKRAELIRESTATALAVNAAARARDIRRLVAQQQAAATTGGLIGPTGNVRGAQVARDVLNRLRGENFGIASRGQRAFEEAQQAALSAESARTNAIIGGILAGGTGVSQIGSTLIQSTPSVSASTAPASTDFTFGLTQTRQASFPGGSLRGPRSSAAGLIAPSVRP